MQNFRTVGRLGLLFGMLGWSVLPASALDGGSVVGWMRPSDELRDTVHLDDTNGQEVASLRLMFADVAMLRIKAKDGKPGVELRRVVNDLRFRRDEWLHVAFVWQKEGDARFYINGKTWSVAAMFGDKNASVEETRVDEIAQIRFREGMTRDFRVMNRPLSAAEVLDDYYAACPVDLAMDDAYVVSGTSGAARWTLAPAGALTRPKVAEGYDCKSARVEIATEVRRIDDTGERKRQDVLDEVLSSTPFAEYDVTKPIEMKTTAPDDTPGRYRLSVRIRRPGSTETFLRTLFFRVFPKISIDTSRADDSAWRTAAPFFVKRYARPEDARWSSGETHTATDASGDYLEAGLDVANRFADIVTIPADAIDRPCLIEIEWPDDKPRQMGLYMYEITGNSCRDHLQGGLVTGLEIPNTHTRQTRAYLYYPSNTNALFEARTFAAGHPAAVAKVTLSRLVEPLPVLKVNRPKTLPGRRFGHTDEDQTFDNNLSKSIMGGEIDVIFANLISYFGYTGQNAFAYPTIRYTRDFTPVDGVTQLSGPWPREQALWKGVIRTMADNGIEFVSQPTLGNVPTFAHCDQTENTLEARGLILKDVDGKNVSGLAKGVLRGDLSKREALEVVMDDIVPGLRYTLEGGAKTLVLDFNTELFSPFMYQSEKSGPQDVRARTAVVTRAFRTLVERLRAVEPDLKVVCVVSGKEEARLRYGVDPDELAAVGGITFAVSRGNTDYYFKRFYGKSMGELTALDDLYDPEAKILKSVAARCPGGALTLGRSTPSYFETFVKPLGNDKRFGNYFQDADIKPHGRWFLKEPAYLLAKADVQNYQIGAQPLGSLGNEAETREFVRAYEALPACPFVAVSGADDPIVARYLETEEGLFVYVVNYSHLSVEAKLTNAPGAADVTELSTERPADLASIALKPFELRSFRLKKGTCDPTTFVLSLGAFDRRAFDARRQEVEAALAKLAAGGIDVATARAGLAEAVAATDAGRLAAAHWWFYHRTVNAAMEKFAQYDAVVAEAKMNARGRWAVNCGNSGFTTIGNRIFSPDRPWDGETYGYVGATAKTCVRDKELCAADCPERELYATELYALSGYRFALPKGRYHVKLYAKWAYPHTYKAVGRMVVAYTANGCPIGEPLDFYAASNGDITKPYCLETTVDVKDRLEIGLRGTGSVGDAATLLNAIEIERVD